MTFRIVPLPASTIAPLLMMDDTALAAHRARWVIADSKPGFPCRVSLEDAEPGERVLLLHHVHQHAETPFRASHAIYVRERAQEADPACGAVPAQFLHRTLSLRGFDADGMMRTADLTPGRDLAERIEAMFADPAIAEIHLHYAAPGCFAARAIRVSA